MCNETIGKHDVEIELQFRIGDGRPSDAQVTLYFHRVCATVCNVEWSRFRRSA